MPVNLFVQLAIGIALMAVGFVLSPRAKSNSQASSPQDFTSPKASAGDPIPVIFGTITLKEPNILWEGESITERYKV